MQPVHQPRENPTLALECDLQLIEHLDHLGFDEVWIGEHHSTGWETVASPDIFIATAAARTRHIKLGSGVVPLSLHHPLLVADNYVFDQIPGWNFVYRNLPKSTQSSQLWFDLQFKVC
jgi:limonene 1,2-monooxygenase